MIELRKMWKRHQLLITGGYILLGTAWLLLIWFFVLSKEAGLSAFIIGFFSALMVIFPASLLCAPIVKRFVNQKIQEFAGLLNSALKIIKGFADDEKNGLEKNSIDFLSSWVLFTGNRWMLTWAMWASTSFFIILSSVLGTILFLEQNKKLGIQNELLSSQNSLAYVETFAEFGKPFRVEKKNFTFPLELSIGESSCGFEMKFNGTHELYPVPNKSDLEQLKSFAKSDVIGRDVVNSLRLLTEDDHPTVRLAALMALDEVDGGLDGLSYVVLDDLYIHDVDISSDIVLIIKNSFSYGISCQKCKIHINGSYFLGNNFDKLGSVSNSFLETDADILPPRMKNSLLKMGSKTKIDEDVFNEKFSEFGQPNFYLKQGKVYSGIISDSLSEKSCVSLKEACEVNKMLLCQSNL